VARKPAFLRTPRPQARPRRKLAIAIMTSPSTITGPGPVPVLTAGPWATGRPASLDPGDWSLAAFDRLARLTGDQP